MASASPWRCASLHLTASRLNRLGSDATVCATGRPGASVRTSTFWGGWACNQSRDSCVLLERQNTIGGSRRKPAKGPLLVMARKNSGFAELFSKKKSPPPGVRRPPLKKGVVSPPLVVPAGILRPPYSETGEQPAWNEDLQIHDQKGVEAMRAAGRLAAQVRDYAGTLVKPGITTDEIDKAVHAKIVEAGAYPSPLNYGRFPKSVCTSVNECICHGIPDSRPLLDGDIINIDVTVYLNGYHGDTSKTFFCGNVDKEARQLVKVTQECLDRAIAICGPEVELKLIGQTINDLADKYKYGVVRHFVGHGVGRVFHSGPAVAHHRNNQRGRMVVGQTFTIEPMLTMGSIKEVMWDDNWTVCTADGSLSAQFEHTILITEKGAEILTL